MPAYLIFTREGPVKDPQKMEAYSAANRANAEEYASRFGIKPLSVYGHFETLEGEDADGVVLLEFPTIEDARGWYESPQYQAAMADRLKAADYRVILFEGI
ncbi:DUF1330 domain-containing protein [Parasphingorhabdus sp.]|uniref:DUF1330 domain-containing protein n=1 Tax=Parasphingorhabdus sp. TaxID=2709688 RepID=UPI003A957AFB